MSFKQSAETIDQFEGVAITRAVLSTPAEMREQLLLVTRTAEHSLSIYTAALSDDLYGHAPFLDALKQLVLARRYARVRILSSDTMPKSKQPICAMATRLPSLIEIRNVPADTIGAAEFVVADSRALIYRVHRSRWDGMVELNDAAVAKFYLTHFDLTWANAMPSQVNAQPSGV